MCVWHVPLLAHAFLLLIFGLCLPGLIKLCCPLCLHLFPTPMLIWQLVDEVSFNWSQWKIISEYTFVITQMNYKSKTMLGSDFVSQEQKAKAAVGIGWPNLDSWVQEKQSGLMNPQFPLRRSDCRINNKQQHESMDPMCHVSTFQADGCCVLGLLIPVNHLLNAPVSVLTICIPSCPQFTHTPRINSSLMMYNVTTQKSSKICITNIMSSVIFSTLKAALRAGGVTTLR